MHEPDDDLAELLADQRCYYQARAPGYDLLWDWAERSDPDVARHLVDLRRWVSALPRAGTVLDVAAGTGQWTPLLLGDDTERLVAVDAAPETLAILTERCPDPRIEPLVADLFAWLPEPGAFDLAFCGFWLSHVPEVLLDDHLRGLGTALASGGVFAFADSGADTTAFDEERVDETVVHRMLPDGSVHRAVKVGRSADAWRACFARLGWTADITALGSNFVMGTARPPA